MAGKQVNFEVNVDSSDGVRGLKDFSRAAQQAGKEAAKGLEDTASASDKAVAAIKAMAEAFDAELRDAAKAADALGQALGPELTSKMDLDQVVQDINKMGVSFDELTAEADKFAAALKEVDDQKMRRVADGVDQVDARMRSAAGGIDQVDTSLRRVTSSTDGVTASSIKARNATANLWGNAAQDLGQFIGISGSAGVAIGQIAEGAADAANDGEAMSSVLKGVGASVGPMLAIVAATAGIALAMKAFKGDSAEVAENTEEMTESFVDGVSAIDDWKSAISEAFGAGTVGSALAFSDQMATALEKALDPAQFDQLRVAMSNLGLTFEDLAGLAETNSENLGAQAEETLKAAGATDEMIARIKELIAENGNATDAVIALKNEMALTDIDNTGLIQFIEDNKSLVDSIDEVGESFDKLDITEAAQHFLRLERSISPATQAMVNQAIATTRTAQGTIDYVAALQEYIRLRTVANRVEEETARRLERTGEELNALMDQYNQAEDVVPAAADSFDQINKTLSEHGREVGLIEGSWKTLIADVIDGHAATEEARDAWSLLRNELHLSREEMADLVDQKVAEELERQAAAADALAEAIRQAGIEMNTTASRAEGIAAAFDTLNDSTALSTTNTQETLGFVNDMQGALEALAKVDLAESDLITSDWNALLDEDLGTAITAVGQWRQSVQSEMAQAFSEDGPEGLRAWADSTRAGIESAMRGTGDFTEAEIQEVLNALGLLPEQVDLTIELAHKEQVLAALSTIAAGIEGLPASTAFDIEMAINDNDPATAVQLINDYLLSIGAEPISVDIVADDGGTAQQTSDDLDAAAVPRTAKILAQPVDTDKTKGAIDAVAAPRTAPITPSVIPAFAAIANLALEQIAATRTADINVLIHGGVEAEQRLDQIAEDRYADIFVTTHGTTTGGTGTGPGPEAESFAVGPTATAVTPLAAVTTSSISPITQTPFTPAPAFQPTINIHAGVLGNHFDIERTVARALRRYQRINGRRG